MRWCLIIVYLWFNHAKTTVPISIKRCTKMAYVPGSNIRLFTFKYIFKFEDGDPFSASLNVKQVHLIVLYIILFYILYNVSNSHLDILKFHIL